MRCRGNNSLEITNYKLNLVILIYRQVKFCFCILTILIKDKLSNFEYHKTSGGDKNLEASSQILN